MTKSLPSPPSKEQILLQDHANDVIYTGNLYLTREDLIWIVSWVSSLDLLLGLAPDSKQITIPLGEIQSVRSSGGALYWPWRSLWITTKKRKYEFIPMRWGIVPVGRSRIENWIEAIEQAKERSNPSALTE